MSKPKAKFSDYPNFRNRLKDLCDTSESVTLVLDEGGRTPSVKLTSEVEIGEDYVEVNGELIPFTAIVRVKTTD